MLHLNLQLPSTVTLLLVKHSHGSLQVMVYVLSTVVLVVLNLVQSSADPTLELKLLLLIASAILQLVLQPPQVVLVMVLLPTLSVLQTTV
jgi:hypothetical protein